MKSLRYFMNSFSVTMGSSSILNLLSADHVSMATSTMRVLSCSLKICGIKTDLMAIIIIIPDLTSNPLHIKHQQRKHFYTPTVFSFGGLQQKYRKIQWKSKLNIFLMSVLRIIFRLLNFFSLCIFVFKFEITIIAYKQEMKCGWKWMWDIPE